MYHHRPVDGWLVGGDGKEVGEIRMRQQQRRGKDWTVKGCEQVFRGNVFKGNIFMFANNFNYREVHSHGPTFKATTVDEAYHCSVLKATSLTN